MSLLKKPKTLRVLMLLDGERSEEFGTEDLFLQDRRREEHKGNPGQFFEMKLKPSHSA